MKKKIILSIIIIAVTIIAGICGFFLIVEVESKIPNEENTQVTIHTDEFMSRKVFTIIPKEQNEKTILYFHGGAYMAEMTDNHWKFLQKLSNDTKTKIIVPDYPLSPKYTYKAVLEMTTALYIDITNKINTDNLIMMGDSAGGGLTLGLEEKIVKDNMKLPVKTILISPWLDTSMTNPKIEEIQPKDIELNKFKLFIAGALYSRGIKDNEKYFVNPVDGDISKLNNITIYTGTYDILNPDSHLLQERAKKVGVNIKINEYETAPHIWMINNNDSLSKKAYEDLLNEKELKSDLGD